MVICTSSLSKLSCKCKKIHKKKLVSNFQNYFLLKTFEIKIKNIEKHEIGKNSCKRRTLERPNVSKVGAKIDLVTRGLVGSESY